MSENAGLGKIKETHFWRALESLFVGAKVEGKSGFINLMRVKSAYFRKSARPALEEKIEERAPRKAAASFREEIFDKLYTFFSRYFCESGSVYFRHIPRWEETCDRVYAEEQDIALAWKTRRLYYVKSDTLVRSMPVELPAEGSKPIARFYFDASEFENKKNNERCEFVFKYAGKHTDAGDVSAVKIGVARATNGRKTDFGEIEKRARKDDFRLRAGDLERACAIFNRQTEADFFIHKDAGGFLREQFDFWLHQFMFQKENDFSHARFLQLQALRGAARDTIDFVSQFEDELRRIWEKPKFARAVHYVVTADKLSPALRAKFAAHAGMKAQIEEWKALKIAPQPFAAKKFRDGEKSHRFLPLDTLHFPDLEAKTLAGFDNLAEALDGEMWRGDNWQALNTLQNRFAGRVKCVYIDPPYNTTNDKLFEYKDQLGRSSWLTMMQNRLEIAKTLMLESGYIYLQLDHYADYLGRFLLQQVFPNVESKDQTVITWNTGDNISGYKVQRDNWIRQADKILFFPKNPDEAKFIRLWKPLQKEANRGIGWLDFIGSSKTDLYVECWQNGELRKKKVDVPSKRIGTVWNDIYSFQYSETRETESFGFRTQKPENLLRRVIQSCTDPREVVLDFCAGSGTTPAVAQKLGRKWLAVEAGEHFSTVYSNNGGKKQIGMLGRLKIVLAGDKKFQLPDNEVVREPHLSKDVNWEGGGFFKYGAFEQYEETLRRVQYDDGENIFYDENKSPFEQYVFLVDKKCAARFARLSKSGKIEVDLCGLYPDIDIAESLANILGKQIKKRTADTVEFVDGEIRPLNPAKMSEEQKMEFIKTMRPFVWWGAE